MLRNALLASLLVSLGCKPDPKPETTPKPETKITPETNPNPALERPPADEAKVLAYLDAVGYTGWKTFPVDQPIPIRLGLPVHGRWVTTYANDVAHAALVAASKPDALDAAVDLPPMLGRRPIVECYAKAYTKDTPWDSILGMDETRDMPSVSSSDPIMPRSDGPAQQESNALAFS
ncbi:MAG: hypothetical protein AB1Z98_11000 [Nannocystaceae bacterium]